MNPEGNESESVVAPESRVEWLLNEAIIVLRANRGSRELAVTLTELEKVYAYFTVFATNKDK